MAEFDYKVTAYHESGHAVASYLLEVPIESVYVTPGLSECRSGLKIGGIVNRNLIRQCVTVAAVGAAVERIFFGHADSASCKFDENVIEELLARIEDDKERQDLQENLQELAMKLTQEPRFLEAVKLLAEELLKQPGTRKEIQGTRVVAIIQAVLAP